MKGNTNMDKRTTRILRLQRFASAGIGRALILGLLICAGAIEAHAAEALGPVLPGARSGVLQQTGGGIVRIDGVKYPLADQALIQTNRGSLLTAKLLEKMNGQHVNVQYLLGTGARKGEIVRIIILAQR
jgi:hypothetical protein